jgi:hypothetical protein
LLGAQMAERKNLIFSFSHGCDKTGDWRKGEGGLDKVRPPYAYNPC